MYLVNSLLYPGWTNHHDIKPSFRCECQYLIIPGKAIDGTWWGLRVRRYCEGGIQRQQKGELTVTFDWIMSTYILRMKDSLSTN